MLQYILVNTRFTCVIYVTGFVSIIKSAVTKEEQTLLVNHILYHIYQWQLGGVGGGGSSQVGPEKFNCQVCFKVTFCYFEI